MFPCLTRNESENFLCKGDDDTACKGKEAIGSLDVYKRQAVGILKKGGYVVMDKDGYLSLTDSGLEVAKKIYERHTTLTDFLVRLGVDKNTAVEDACKMEMCIRDRSGPMK